METNVSSEAQTADTVVGVMSYSCIRDIVD